MKTPTVEQLQAWTQLWDEAKRYQGYQKAFEQASDASEIRQVVDDLVNHCLLYTSPSPRDGTKSRMPSSA